MLNIRALCFLLPLWLSGSLIGGTLIFKDGTKISDVTIVSINEGRVVVEKDKANKTYNLNQIASFYQANLKGDDAAPEGEFADYDVSIINIKMPTTGLDKSSDKEKEAKVSKCDVTFSIKRKGEHSDVKKVRAPYFHLYVLTHSDKDYGGRVIYRYSYPKDFKVKGKSYDKASVMEVLDNFDRQAVYFDQSTSLAHGSGVGKGFGKGGFNDRTAEFELKDVKSRKILAYYLEVWGDKDIVVTKNWASDGIGAGDRWWEKYSGGKAMN